MQDSGFFPAPKGSQPCRATLLVVAADPYGSRFLAACVAGSPLTVGACSSALEARNFSLHQGAPWRPFSFRVAIRFRLMEWGENSFAPPVIAGQGQVQRPVGKRPLGSYHSMLHCPKRRSRLSVL
jgi:hypothetical protein